MSVRLLTSGNGTPLMAYGTKFFATTTGIPASIESSSQLKKVEDTTNVGSYECCNWGPNNDFPTQADMLIGKTGVLSTGLRFLHRVVLGQGIFPCRVTGYDAKGNETLEVINDPAIISFLQSRPVRRYLSNAYRDIIKFGISFPQLIPNIDGTKLIGINTINALHCRLTKPSGGQIENCIVSGEFPDISNPKNIEVYPVLDNYDPSAALDRLRYAGKIAGKSYIYPLRDEWDNNDIYPLPSWWAAKLAGWVDVANKIPAFLSKAYENQITWMWHVKIPYAYWDKRYPLNEYKDPEARRQKIQEDIDKIEESLTDTKNANKAIFTHYSIGNNGKPEEQWIIESLDNKYKADDKLLTSAAANSEILFSLMVNPNVLGAGMPGGTYAGNQGGSNIREAFLVNIAMAWLDRQNLLDPIEAMLAFNGIEDVQLRFRNTILTTLDSGAGTTKNMA
ncbi:MAG: hypothetical protein RSB69_11080 [Odoribacter sp.]